MSNLVDHAKREFELTREPELDTSGMTEKEIRIAEIDKEYCDSMEEAVIELLEVFSKQGHSGFSAPAVNGLFHTLANFKPLGPLTGVDEEWTKINEEMGCGNDMAHQNKRCSHVFKRADGTSYDIQGKVFVEPNGCSYTSSDSRVEVVFPYTPTTEYVNVTEEETEEVFDEN